MMFDKSTELFPIKKKYIFLSHCGISPFFSQACRKEQEIAEEHQNNGGLLFMKLYQDVLDGLRKACAELLKVKSDDIAFVKNTSEGMSLIAAGYPFAPGDEVIGYTCEYPANFYPWKLQETRGAEFTLLPNADSENELPTAWTMADLERKVSKRTRIVAVSHVQFTSGFAADLAQLGEFCRSRDIDLVVDVAQSLGSLPVYPEEYHISALASSGWKWLMGPIGTGLLYTSKKFRDKLDQVMVGAEVMLQGVDYLDHTWNPHSTAKKFEYSTSPVSLAAALQTCIKDISLRYGVENIRNEIFRNQEVFLKLLDRDKFSPLSFPEKNRSGIISIVCKRHDPGDVVKELQKEDIVCTARGGYLRVAPHFYNTEEELEKTAGVLNNMKSR